MPSAPDSGRSLPAPLSYAKVLIVKESTPIPPAVPLNGVLVIDKPGNMTSHDVVTRIRRRLSIQRVGHLGTLDPAATGVLPVTIGKATRLARFIPSSPKEYTGEIRLGWSTTTCDLEGDRLGESRTVEVPPEEVLAAMAQLTGGIEQVPPIYSAKKISGIRAHRLARQGNRVALDPVPVEILEFELIDFRPPFITFRVVCSGGTYVRALARDLGEALKTGGHLYSLRRIRSGDFDLSQAIGIDSVSWDEVIPAEQLLLHLERLDVEDQLEQAISHGRAVPCEIADSPLRIFNKKGQLIAIAAVERGWARPQVVLL
jgi:tRNA pseudouridine55 synthase